MHKLGQFIQDQMDLENIKRSDLVRRSGLTRQHVHTLLRNQTLSRMPDMQTLEALGRAFPQVGEDTFIWKAAEAVGVPVDRLVTVQPDPAAISNEMLLELLRRRLGEGGEGHDRSPAKTPPPPDEGGGSVTVLHGGEGPPDVPAGAEVMHDDVAAYEGTTEDPQRQARRQQDEDAERGDS